jgi:hypothetical protein
VSRSLIPQKTLNDAKKFKVVVLRLVRRHLQILRTQIADFDCYGRSLAEKSLRMALSRRKEAVGPHRRSSPPTEIKASVRVASQPSNSQSISPDTRRRLLYAAKQVFVQQQNRNTAFDAFLVEYTFRSTGRAVFPSFTIPVVQAQSDNGARSDVRAPSDAMGEGAGHGH